MVHLPALSRTGRGRRTRKGSPNFALARLATQPPWQYSIDAEAKARSSRIGVNEVKMVPDSGPQKETSRRITNASEHTGKHQILYRKDDAFTILGAKASASIVPGS